jgi:hypothetical protein
MPTLPVDSSYCVHCGYERVGLVPDATHCPECAHALKDTRILAMASPPRWWRIHRTGWSLFRLAGTITYLAALPLVTAMLLVFFGQRFGIGSASWTSPTLDIMAKVMLGVLVLSVLLVAAGGVCCLATVPAESPKNQQRARLFSLFSLAVPLLAFPAAYGIAFNMPIPRQIVLACATLSIVLIIVDARLLPGRAHAFVRFTTNDPDNSFLTDDNSYGIFAVILVGYVIYFGFTANAISFLYLFATIGWVTQRASAAKAVRDEIALAQRQARRTRPPTPPAPNSHPNPAVTPPLVR